MASSEVANDRFTKPGQRSPGVPLSIRYSLLLGELPWGRTQIAASVRLLLELGEVDLQPLRRLLWSRVRPATAIASLISASMAPSCSAVTGRRADAVTAGNLGRDTVSVYQDTDSAAFG